MLLYCPCLCCLPFCFVFMRGMRICASFYRLFMYVLPLKIQLSGEGGWDLINRFNTVTFVCLFQGQDLHFQSNISFTFYIGVFFPLSLSRLLLNLTAYMSNTASKKQELIILREHLTSHPVFWWRLCCSFLKFFVLSEYVSLCSEFRVVMSVTIST